MPLRRLERAGIAALTRCLPAWRLLHLVVQKHQQYPLLQQCLVLLLLLLLLMMMMMMHLLQPVVAPG